MVYTALVTVGLDGGPNPQNLYSSVELEVTKPSGKH